ncbi:MAG: uroporphyrinogen-III synthase [Pseudomonadota bacterium]
MSGTNKTVWITRPEPGNAKTCANLKAAGFDAVSMPLTKTVPVRTDIVIDEDASLLVTSGAAIRLLDPSLAAQLLHHPLFAVGEGTATVAKETGFQDVVVANGNAESLGSLITETAKPHTKFHYLAGRIRTPYLENALIKRDFDVAVSVVYDTQKVSQMTYSELQYLETASPAAVVFHSVLSVEVWFSEINRSFGKQASDSTTFFFVSPRIAAAVPEASVLRRQILNSAADEDLIAQLQDAIEF